MSETEMNWKETLVERDDERAIKFVGVEIASAWDCGDRGHPNYSGSPGRWTVLNLYRTKGGKLVCERIERTQWQGEHDQHSGLVCESERDVIEFFGHGRLAKEVYAEANINTALEIA